MANKRLLLGVQEGVLKSSFPNSLVKRNKERSLTWIHIITPSELSDDYKVKLHYERGKGVSFYVIEPKLRLADGKVSLPHVYSTEEQKLCLYYPKDREWHSGLLFTKTIIPWACEWLLHYEIWVYTGNWNGGGVHDINEEPKVELSEE